MEQAKRKQEINASNLFYSSTSSVYLAASQIASALEQALYKLLSCVPASELSHVLLIFLLDLLSKYLLF